MDEIDEKNDDKEPALYELGFLLDPGLSERELSVVTGEVAAFLSASGGEIVLSESPKLRTLAYAIEKSLNNKKMTYGKAFFGWLKFMFSPNKIDDLEHKLRSSPSLIRYLLIHTVKTTATAPRRWARKASVPTVQDKKTSEEEIEKEVEILIASTSPTANVSQ